MAIRRSASGEIDRLIVLLGGADGPRQAAIARLSVIGPRAVARLVEIAARGRPRERMAALQALDAIDDSHALDGALAALVHADDDVVIAAMPVARRFLRSRRGAEALDGVTAVALDTTRSERVRLAALEALNELPAATLAPLRARLRLDSSAALRQAAAGTARRPAPADPVAELEQAAGGVLPAEPEEIGVLLETAGDRTPLSTLHRLVGILRGKETAELAAGRRARWRAARGAVHRTLAARRSRVALYDLRETLERAGDPVPLAYAQAIGVLGDVSCLEPIAVVCSRLRAPGGTRDCELARALSTAFRSIMRREHVSRRHAAVRRIRDRWPELAPELLEGPAGTRARPPGRSTRQ